MKAERKVEVMEWTQVCMKASIRRAEQLRVEGNMHKAQGFDEAARELVRSQLELIGRS